MLIFLDTEYTNMADRDLISLAMVSEDGKQEIYIEIEDFPKNAAAALSSGAYCHTWANNPYIASSSASYHKSWQSGLLSYHAQFLLAVTQFTTGKY
ncbi:Uncharacterised protein [Chromobacterium violaceum]|uniref:Uncharacterized protein n=1 Tax=Chromobacterium violaceum TaxID=536 RepID=A0A3S4HR99_CHRVL|nr:Uncharacterised protein [Chromobacterium violaceum]